MLAAIIIAVVLAILLIALCIGLYIVYRKTFYSPPRDMPETYTPDFLSRHPYRETSNARTKRLNETPCEIVTTRSYDKLTLSARYYQGKADKPLCILFHGYHGSAIRDWAGIGLQLIDEGYPVLSVDERAHWHSGGHTITYGIRERKDVLSWLAYANSRFGASVPIYLFGISMGGGTVLMASGEQLPDNVRGVIADCPFNVPKDIILHVCRRINLNPTLCWPLIRLSALVFGHFNINETCAAEQVKKTTKPIMIIHGGDDDFVPGEMSREVYEANPAMVEYHTIPEAGHGLSYYYDSEQYQSLVNAFLQKHP